MHRLMIIIGLLFALGNVASPSMAAAMAATATVQAAIADSDDHCVGPAAETAKVAAFKPCAKKVNGKAVLSCHLPPVVLPAEIELFADDGAGVFEAPAQRILLSTVFSGHFRPPRLAAT